MGLWEFVLLFVDFEVLLVDTHGDLVRLLQSAADCVELEGCFFFAFRGFTDACGFRLILN